VTFSGVDPATLQPGKSIRFFTQASAAVGVSAVTMFYQRLDEPNSPVQQMSLYDDGQHGDGAISDNVFGGDLEASLPWGAEIQFYFEVTDLDQQVVQVPDEPVFGRPGQPGNVFQLALSSNGPPIEISEVVPKNFSGITDESGANPDWVEVRNTSTQPVRMDGVGLSHGLGDSSRYYWPTGTILGPGEHTVVYCDGNPSQGPLHAPIRLSSSGDVLLLSAQTTNNSPYLLDWVQFGAMPTDLSYARLGVGGDWFTVNATPSTQNAPAQGIFFLQTSGLSNSFVLAFATTNNATYTIEQVDTIGGAANWRHVQTCTGDGFEKAITGPLEQSGFFRVRKEP
jgi:hypothetical protein